MADGWHVCGANRNAVPSCPVSISSIVLSRLYDGIGLNTMDGIAIAVCHTVFVPFVLVLA